jgi:hypothetical protein
MGVSYMFLDLHPQLDFSLTSVLDDVSMYITIANNTSPTITF